MILADTHVHIHSCFDLRLFFSSTISNFAAASREKNLSGDVQALLCLTETPGTHVFDVLLKEGEATGGACRSVMTGTFISRTDEEISLAVWTDQKVKIFLVAGRQIPTAEKVEVLALGTREDFPRDEAMDMTLKRVSERGAIPVLAWGPGKWTGTRKRRIRGLLDREDLPAFFLGDNGNRLALWPKPRLLTLGEVKGHQVLPGSDPLPFSSEAHRVARFGLVMDRELTSSCPAGEFLGFLGNEDVAWMSFGRLEKPLRFLHNQLFMHIRNRLS